MKVSRLIELLALCPQDLDIEMYYDGAPRLIPDMAYLGKEDPRYGEIGFRSIIVLAEERDVYNLERDAVVYFRDAPRRPYE